MNTLQRKIANKMIDEVMKKSFAIERKIREVQIEDEYCERRCDCDRKICDIEILTIKPNSRLYMYERKVQSDG